MLKDITKNFYTLNNDILYVEKLQAVLENVHNILAIEPGELPMSDKGTSLRRFLFQPINTFIASEIIYEIEQSLLYWERSIEDIEIVVYPLPSQNTFDIKIYLKVVNVDEIAKYELNLSEVRGNSGN